MQRAILSVVFAGLFVGCVYCAGPTVERLSYELDENLYTQINSTGQIAGKGATVGWKITWNLLTNDFAQIGPYFITDNNGIIISSLQSTTVKAENGNSTQSYGTEYQTVDPCVHRVLNYEPNNDLYSNFQVYANATDGVVNVTEYRDILPTVGLGSNRTAISLACPIECNYFNKYVLFNTTTNLSNYITVLNFTSGIQVFMTYAYEPGRCPSTWGHYSHIDSNSTTTIEVYNHTQIWLMFNTYTLTNSEKDNVIIEWSIIPNDSGSTKPSNDILLWGLLAGGIVLILVVVVVVVVIIRKKRASYDQIQ